MAHCASYASVIAPDIISLATSAGRRYKTGYNQRPELWQSPLPIVAKCSASTVLKLYACRRLQTVQALARAFTHRIRRYGPCMAMPALFKKRITPVMHGQQPCFTARCFSSRSEA